MIHETEIEKRADRFDMNLFNLIASAETYKAENKASRSNENNALGLNGLADRGRERRDKPKSQVTATQQIRNKWTS